MLRPDRVGPLDVDKIVTLFANAGFISPCVSVWKKVIFRDAHEPNPVDRIPCSSLPNLGER